MAEVTKDDLKELEKGMLKCVGDECDKLKKDYEQKIETLRNQGQSGAAPPQHDPSLEKLIETRVKDCVGAECEKLRKEEIPRAIEEHQVKQMEGFKESNPEAYDKYMKILGLEEEEPKQDDFCEECSMRLPPGQLVKFGEDGCTHSPE